MVYASQNGLRFIGKSVLLLLLTSFVTGAQLNEASLKGTVTDLSGSVIAGSTVVATNESTAQVRSTVTDESGSFFLGALTPGSYTITARAPGFKTLEQRNLKLNVGEMTGLSIRLEVGAIEETVEISAGEAVVRVSTEGRLTDTFINKEIGNLPLAQRDIFLLPKLSAGATAIPGAASSTKLTNSPVITVNGNRYRGNNYVLDGAMNTNQNNSGEPAIVPSLESLEEVQVQTGNFSSEFGRGNGAVINLRTRSGTNWLHGRAWSYHRNSALNARNFFAVAPPHQVFNQFGANLGGPILKNRTFFFGSYEGTRNAVGQALTFQVETPEFRDYVMRVSPSGVTARLLREFPAPTPLPGTDGKRYLDQQDIITPQGVIPAIGRVGVTLNDYIRFDQYMARIDHSLGKDDRLTGRWIAEYQRDLGGTSSSRATLGKAMRGSRGPFNGFFANLNLGYVHVLDRAINDVRASLQIINTTRGNEEAVVPDITVTGLTAPFGDSFLSSTRLRTYEIRDTVTLDRGRHSIRLGFELRRIFKGLSIGPATTGAFFFETMNDFALDRPFRQTLTVNPETGQPTGFGRYFTFYESAFFIQEDWKVNSRLNFSIGLRHDYFGDVSEREGRLSSIILGPGDDFRERLANASIGRVDRLYKPELANFAPRIGLALDPFGDGKTSLRAGFSLAYQPHHGQSIAGARALPPDAIQGVIQPSSKIGTTIFYDIPVPFNPEFGRGLNASGGVKSRPGEPPIRTTGFVVNPDIKTQYSESWFLNIQRELASGLIASLGYVGTNGINLERIDDVNRFRGDLLGDGKEDRINPNFSSLLFVTNGVTSSYHSMTAELRANLKRGLSIQANYRWSKWLDTSSDTSTGQFADNSEPGKGAVNIDCLACERGRSLFDIPHRFSAAIMWAPRWLRGQNILERLARDWEMSAIITAQSGRPFSVWNGASFKAGGDYNADGGGGAVGGGFYDRPDAPAPGAVKSSFSNKDFVNGLFDASIFPKPLPGHDGTLGRNTFRGPKYITADLCLARSFALRDQMQIQLRLEAFNALNNVNLFLPNTDLSLSSFGKSTQAFEARTLQLGVRFSF
jgi:hypothetical protein